MNLCSSLSVIELKKESVAPHTSGFNKLSPTLPWCSLCYVTERCCSPLLGLYPGPPLPPRTALRPSSAGASGSGSGPGLGRLQPQSRSGSGTLFPRLCLSTNLWLGWRLTALELRRDWRFSLPNHSRSSCDEVSVPLKVCVSTLGLTWAGILSLCLVFILNVPMICGFVTKCWVTRVCFMTYL